METRLELKSVWSIRKQFFNNEIDPFSDWLQAPKLFIEKTDQKGIETFYPFHNHAIPEIYYTIRTPACAEEFNNFAIRENNPLLKTVSETDSMREVEFDGSDIKNDEFWVPTSPKVDDLIYFHENTIHAFDIKGFLNRKYDLFHLNSRLWRAQWARRKSNCDCLGPINGAWLAKWLWNNITLWIIFWSRDTCWKGWTLEMWFDKNKMETKETISPQSIWWARPSHWWPYAVNAIQAAYYFNPTKFKPTKFKSPWEFNTY